MFSVVCLCVCVCIMWYVGVAVGVAQDSTQQTMLTTWLVELFLNDLGALRDEGDRDGHAKLTQEFHEFLQSKNLQVLLRQCLKAVDH